MLLAALGNVAGDLPALEAVLRSIDQAGILTIVNTGNCVVGGPSPNEVIDLLRDRRIECVQGEMDRLVCMMGRKPGALRAKRTPEEFDALRAAHDWLKTSHLQWLRALPKEHRMCIDGVSILLCHGGPSGPLRDLDEDAGESRFLRERERANADIVVCGRTKPGFARLVEGTLFVNPGWMSGGTSAAAEYAIIDAEQEPWTAEFRQARGALSE